VTGDQLSGEPRRRGHRDLLAEHGPDRQLEPVPGPGDPQAAALADADLTGLGMPRSRSATLSAVASASLANPNLFDAHRGLDEAVHDLRAIRGVGEWTAQYIALRQLREPDAFPAADIGLMRALAEPDGTRPSAEAMARRAERWRPWRAYAAQHLWAADPGLHAS
jgi:AraC family transcriptional regulator of adaptative response / DNA-3-methyladenine glycosylase II